MKKFATFIFLGAIFVIPTKTSAWVTYCRPAYRPVYRGCWHGGWGCGGVITRPPVVVAPAPIVVAPAPVIVNPSPVVIQPTIPIGSTYYSLPAGAQSANINGTQYYVANGVYYQPFFGSNGVYYQVVANPI